MSCFHEAQKFVFFTYFLRVLELYTPLLRIFLVLHDCLYAIAPPESVSYLFNSSKLLRIPEFVQVVTLGINFGSKKIHF